MKMCFKAINFITFAFIIIQFSGAMEIEVGKNGEAGTRYYSKQGLNLQLNANKYNKKDFRHVNMNYAWKLTILNCYDTNKLTGIRKLLKNNKHIKLVNMYCPAKQFSDRELEFVKSILNIAPECKFRIFYDEIANPKYLNNLAKYGADISVAKRYYGEQQILPRNIKIIKKSAWRNFENMSDKYEKIEESNNQAINLD